MNARPYPRAIVETCGYCSMCRPPDLVRHDALGESFALCPRLLEDIDRAVARTDFYRRVAAAFPGDDMPELQEVYGRGAPAYDPDHRAQEG